MNDQLMILLCGIHSLGFALFHAQFSRLFGWKEDLENLKPVNRSIMQVANYRLMYFFLWVAAVCFLFPGELSTTPLGKFFMAGMSLFWLGRTIEQFLFFKIDHRMVHLLTYLCILGTIMFAIPVFL